jgi:hypothetical protein
MSKHQRLVCLRMIVMRCLCGYMAVLLTCTQPSAKGGGMLSEYPYNPQHIDSLPTEMRNAIYQTCKTARALHTFASYSENLQRIVLHFEHFYCDERNTFCNPSGCLHQVWVSRGNRYRLVRSYYAPN